MTRTPLILLSLLAVGCVQLPAPQNSQTSNDMGSADMNTADAKQDLDTTDQGKDMTASDMSDMPSDMTSNDMSDMADMPPEGDMSDMSDMSMFTACDLNDPDLHATGQLDENSVCTPSACIDGWVDLNMDLTSGLPTADGCECEVSPDEDLPGDGQDSNCDGIDGQLDKAIFVSATQGNDAQDGLTPTTSVKTIERALNIALRLSAQRKYILIAQGQYPNTNAELAPGVSLYGGCDANWSCNADKSTTTISGASTANGKPTLSLTITANDPKTLTLKNLTIQGPVQSTPGISAYTLRFISAEANTTPVIIDSCNIIGGTGANGQDGAAGVAGDNGASTMNSTGASTTCNGQVSTGGTGAAGQTSCPANDVTTAAGTAGTSSSSAQPGAGGQPGASDCSDNDLVCDYGSDAPNAFGANGATVGGSGQAGQLTPTTAIQRASFNLSNGEWSPSAYAPNDQHGEHGAGGGGGGAGGYGVDGSGTTGKGGGGGAGGCGGTAGAHGQAGGASIAIITVNQNISIINTTINLGKGGDGGDGGDGGLGGSGGSGAPGGSGGGTTPTLCGGSTMHGKGGSGAPGGNGGSGAPGNGANAGPVYNIVLINAQETMSGSTTLGGTTGKAGLGGASADVGGTPGHEGGISSISTNPTRITPP